MAGVPFETLEQLSTRATCKAARELIVAQTEFSRTKAAVEQILASRRHDLSKEQFRAWRKAILHGVMPRIHDVPSSAFAECWQSASKVGRRRSRL